ncbi:helix-turn-helix transcriptional regulator [Sphaerisporangium rubeum]|uniref:Transcriptional regulator with XRE-family HTH domain n=1 Tax=Sphaerisporangium rubeum TaxID=321317 RepID=A0A7X0IE84_9ACTN|nr:helix-turn-helix transcriptional regulator [Sphaerisporangium rubeum]MBB6472333.1 transcriptional regulator with XRE-family HTH domain [Sphaerisporangium rubeum]
MSTERPDPYKSPRDLFAFELRRHRQAAELSQRQLARRMDYSDSLINMVEAAKRPPTRRFAELADRALGLDGDMLRLYTATTWNKAPDYLRSWLEEEQEATSLRTWQPSIVPGLLQTESYAREILAAWPSITAEELDERLSNRMQRQAILVGDKPPDLNILLDEDVIRHMIGGAAVMREQLDHLLQVVSRWHVTMQIVPYVARPHCGQMGGFVLAERNGVAYAAYAEAQPVGRTFDERRLIADLIRRYDAIRAQALPVKESLRLVEEAVDRIGV